ncbi:Uncharacterised protein [Flavonifractor plautii]|uniref:Uncharacterized protein n=1 Tax=Flavonifractor plautii TaxID=292800 RepID=A0A174Q2V3_FLAPL|nr:Uncharacterised protein [Flavonifractor plautii]
METLAWVEMWAFTPGACFFSRESTPTSARMAASTPAAWRNSSHSGRRAASSLRGMVLQVTWTATPRLWHSSTACLSSSGVKLPAKERMPKSGPAR